MIIFRFIGVLLVVMDVMVVVVVVIVVVILANRSLSFICRVTNRSLNLVSTVDL